MFDTLLESRPRPTSPSSRWGTAVALALHLVVVASFLRRPRPVQASRPIVIEPLPLPADPHQPETVEEGFLISVPGYDFPLPPIPGPEPIPDAPTGIEPSLRAPGGSAGTPFDPLRPGGGEALSVDLVQELPALLAATPPAYPPFLRAAGVRGRVELQVVVDTLGRRAGNGSNRA